MVTAPSSPKKAFSVEVGAVPSPPAQVALVPAPAPAEKEYNNRGSASAERKFSKEDSHDDDSGEKRKAMVYPSHKFFMTQYIKDDCRIRRWTYEDSIPLSMESNMKYMLKQASNRISFCQNDKEKRGEMLNDLNELSSILDGKN